MTSKTKESGRAEFLLRMPPELKERLAKAAAEDGVTIRDLLLYAAKRLLDDRDAEVAVDKKRADLERSKEAKFEEIVLSLAGGDVTLSADKLIELQELAEAVIEKWRNRAASDHHAEPRTALERLCKNYCDIEDEIEGSTARIETFEDDDFALLDEIDEPGDHDGE